MEQKFPDELGFSMAPFGYSTHAKRTGLSDTSVTYACRQIERGKGCPFQVSIDPRDMNLESIKLLMRQHMDQSH